MSGIIFVDLLECFTIVMKLMTSILIQLMIYKDHLLGNVMTRT